MEGLFGNGFVDDDVLFCGGDSLEEDLRWGPRLGVLWIWWSLKMV